MITKPKNLIKTKKSQEILLETSIYTRGTTQFALNATFRLKQALSLNAGARVSPGKIARTTNSEVIGTKAISYRLTPTADSLGTLSPYRLRHSFYEIIVPHLFSNVKHFFTVKISKNASSPKVFLSKKSQISSFLQKFS